MAEDDFISLWKKKKQEPTKGAPSAIGETLDKLDDFKERVVQLEAENVELKKQIKDNINIMSKSGEALRNAITEKDSLKEVISREKLSNEQELNLLQNENANINIRIKQLENQVKEFEDIALDNALVEKDDVLQAKEEEITQLKMKLEMAAVSETKAPVDSGVDKALIEDLQKELAKKKEQNAEYAIQIKNLTSENDSLISNQMNSQDSKPSGTKQGEVSSNKALDVLCQDLQSKINKYKGVVSKLKADNATLKAAAQGNSPAGPSDEQKVLERENTILKEGISKLEEKLNEVMKEAEKKPVSAENIEELKNQIKEKDALIVELRSLKGSDASVPKALVEDLQSKINKYKRVITKLKSELKK